MDNQQVTEHELGWLVGFFEGEGCIGICRRNRGGGSVSLQPHVQLANCDRDLIEHYCDILKRLHVPFHVGCHPAKKNVRENWQVTVAGHKRVTRILPTLIPLLHGDKKRKAELVLEFAESRLQGWHAGEFTYRQREIFEDVSARNVRGRARNLRDYTPNSPSSKFRHTLTRAYRVEDRVQTTTAGNRGLAKAA